MKYPTLTPETVNKDMVDVFGGYNHNLRIGDNEFYDMNDLSADGYPLLSVRKKRGAVTKGGTGSTNVKSVLYRNRLYTIIAKPVPVEPDDSNIFLNWKEGETDYSASWRSDDITTSRTIIPMGSQMIVLPDKVIVNLSDNLRVAKDIDNETTVTGVSIQPCLMDGTVLALDYIGDTIPEAPADGYVWLDTRNNPAALKKYIATQATWQNFLSTYVKISATTQNNANKISKGFKVGDGVKISGITDNLLTDLNNTSIVKAIPDDYSMVLTGVVDPMPNKYILTAEYTQSRSYIYFYCNENFAANAFQGQRLQINDKLYYCGSSDASESVDALPYYDESVQLSSTGITLTVQDAIPSGSPTNQIYISESAFGGNLSGQQICIGDISNRLFATILAQGSNSSQAASHPGGRFIIIDRSVGNVSSGTVIHPIGFTHPEGLIRVKLSFVDQNNQSNPVTVTVTQGDKACPSLDNQYAQASGAVKFSRKMPVMDFVIESQNRLWGCHYGDDGSGKFVNEIYCSKLGDPTNWSVYEGVSTDSYAASCGTEGEWTGAFNYRGYPTFFKEHHIHTVYGSYPPYQIKDIEARGIQKGSSLSLAQVNEVLFYKSLYGICAYSGGLPEEISAALGDISYKNAVACAYKGKYIVEMKDSGNNPVLFAYDTAKGMWHKETALNTSQMAAGDDNVYFIAPVTVNNTTYQGIGQMLGTNEPFIRWFAESGEYGLSTPDKKYISKLQLRLMLPVGSTVFVSIMYDSSGVWERVTNVIGHSLMPFSLAIKPRRCDHFRLKLEGIGDMKLYSISKTTRQGSDR